MGLTLTTHDTGFDDPDSATIARVLASLDGGRHVLATLAESGQAYVQASGSVQTGFVVEYQEGSLDRHHRSRSRTLPLATVTDIFQRYARSDASWRQAVEWEHVPYVPVKIPWYNTWVGYSLILLTVIILLWLWRR